MDQDHQAELVAIKLALRAIVARVVDPTGTAPAAESNALIASIRDSGRAMVETVTIDVSRSRASAAFDFQQVVAAKLDEIFEGLRYTDD